MVNPPIEGTSVWDSLESELRTASADLSRCETAAKALDGQMSELLSQRGEALLELARHYLPEISRGSIEKTFAAVRNDLLGILARKESRHRELQTQLNAIESDLTQRGNELDDLTRKLNEKVKLREELEAQVAESLKGNAEYQERSRLALEAEAQLHRNEQRVVDIEKEAKEKLPHYDKSVLFRYLYNRGFGTSEYRSSGWVQTIDAWVARLINFGDARIGYEFHKKTAKLVGEEVARRREQFNELMAQVQALQHAEGEKVGLVAALGEGDALGAARDRQVQEIEAIRNQAQALQQDRSELEKAQNQFYRDAIERFRTFLGETKLAVLQQRARETLEPEDDTIVSAIGGLDRRIEEIKPQLNEYVERRKAADRFHQGLDLLAHRYRQANFDSTRSYFETSFDVHSLLNKLHDGSADAEALWQSIRSAQRFRPHWVESATRGGTEVISSPSGRILIGAVVNAATEALQRAASRGYSHNQGNVFPGPSNWPSPAPSEYSPPQTPNDSGGFTSGQGF